MTDKEICTLVVNLIIIGGTANILAFIIAFIYERISNNRKGGTR